MKCEICGREIKDEYCYGVDVLNVEGDKVSEISIVCRECISKLD